jgi:hypothetical protein
VTDSGIKVVAPDGQMSAATAHVAAVWRQGADSPETKKIKAESEAKNRHWAYEASVAIAGRQSTTNKFAAALGFKATLASAQDKLIFSLATENASDDGVTTADRTFGGVDYSSFYSAKNGWYARTSLEKDGTKNLDLRSSSAFGLSRRLIKNERQDLELRVGVSYIYDSYAAIYTNAPVPVLVQPATNFSSAGLDIGFLHTYLFPNSKLTNTITYTPAFKAFNNYRVHHESAWELPIGSSQWKLKLGVANDYNSKPPALTERLDTTYFTNLILNWK